MYFPYLRGKQNELFALKELLELGLLSKSIIPIIEPISLTRALPETLTAFSKANHPIAIVFNPAVGSFADSCRTADSDKTKSRYKDFYMHCVENYSNIIKAVILNKTADSVIEQFRSQKVLNSEIIVILDNRDHIGLYTKYFQAAPPQYTLIPNDHIFLDNVKQNTVLFHDRFVKKARNIDYLENLDEAFSSDHLYYKKFNFSGFSDFSMVGKPFTEDSFSPKAVALHMIYFDTQNELRIAHFVSDSNTTTKDPAKKFNEANKKLAQWYQKNIKSVPLTEGLKRFLILGKSEEYPGLGIAKKLSLMHHFELMSNYLNAKK